MRAYITSQVVLVKVLLQVFVMLGSGQGFDGGMYVANCSKHPVACDMSWKYSMFASLSKDFVI
jgi:hypothetical protein